jgi:uncharacterized membrane protein
MVGPLEFITIEFPGNHFKGEIMPVLVNLVNKGLIRIIDLVFIKKDHNGNVFSFELNEIDKDTARLFNPVIKEIRSMLTIDDIQKVGEALNNNTSAGLMLFEHTWATTFIESVKNANGRLIVDYRIPQEVVEKVLQAAGSKEKITV